ncbi:NHLP bacteriocin export ABC transporter permease/ATPase subunit [Sabulicella rubraurantiaca]|uniref:NHLP bacteriocin export ABC transporter permease/ATPase subunit n=1 Tax=Sabulicella rubraurantiaca TaxID=2811429 RepID=UPI001A973174|nr:NHLP bacteriocin export ABC transporter permease/ATPase subunit [Sabulicella rubraurantiaca]
MSGIAPEAPLHPAGTGPFTPTGPLVMDGGGLWFVVEAGALELRLSPSGQAGLSVPLLRVAAGGVAPCLGNAEHPVRAWPEPGTRLRPVAPEDAEAALLPALEAWLFALLRVASPAPPPEPALPAEGEALAEATLLRPREGVAWALVEAGRLEEPDAAGPAIGPGEVAPLPAAGPGMLGLPGTRLRYLDRSSLLAGGQLPAALERFHAACLTRLAAASQREEESLSSRIAERARSGDAHAAAAVAMLAGQGGKTQEVGEGEGLRDALQRIARALGVPAEGAARAPERTKDRHRAVLAAAEGFRLRARRVRLEPGWRRRAEEPFLGFLAADGSPLALLPGERKPAEAELEPFGYSLSPMLPDVKLGARALLRLGLLGGRRELTTILLVSLLAGLLGLATPYATGLLFESIIPASARGELAQILAGLAAAAVGAGVFGLVRGFALLRLATTVNARLEAAIWDRLLRLPVSFFRGRQAADLAMRADAVNQMREAASGTVVGTALAALFGALNFALLLHYSWRLALVALGLALVQALVMVAAALVQLRLRRRLLDASGRVRSLALELVEGISKLRVAAAEDRGFARFALAFAEEARLALRTRLVSGGVSTFGALWGTLSTGVLIAAVGLGWAQVGIGDFVAFSAAFGQFTSALLSLAGVLPSVLALVPLYERARPILEAVPEDAGMRGDPGTLRGVVELQGVTFRYAPWLPPALDQVTLRAAPGETVALVGPSGSGKSTALRLLLGFEAPEAGAVFLDGRDLAGLDPRAVRRQMGVVLQRGRVLAGSLLENIAGGVPMSAEEAMAAARAAGLEPDIAAMPMGLHTMLPEGGGTLSGGQRQRLMIARALAHRPRILLLDEATSALDNPTQEVVTRNLEAMGVTTIVVAHRLSTVQRAARIYVMDGGKVVEEGRFEELMEAGGLFTRLAARQLA